MITVLHYFVMDMCQVIVHEGYALQEHHTTEVAHGQRTSTRAHTLVTEYCQRCGDTGTAYS